jgi:hypothetical protein
MSVAILRKPNSAEGEEPPLSVRHHGQDQNWTGVYRVTAGAFSPGNHTADRIWQCRADGNPRDSGSLHTLFCPRCIRTIVICLVASTVPSVAAQFHNEAWHTPPDRRRDCRANVELNLYRLARSLGE